MQISGKQLSLPAKLYVVAENRLLRETLVRLFRKRSEISIVGDTCCSTVLRQNTHRTIGWPIFKNPPLRSKLFCLAWTKTPTCSYERSAEA
jgi:hypothetical protein